MQDVSGAKARNLRIEELSCVEHGLFLVFRHLVEEVRVIRVVNQVDATVCELVRRHIRQGILLLLLGADPRRERVTHEEDREVLLDFESGVLGVRHRDHERTFVDLIRYCLLRVAGQVDAIDLVEH